MDFKLIGYDFIIDFKARKENVIVDALSRRLEETTGELGSSQTHYSFRWKNLRKVMKEIEIHRCRTFFNKFTETITTCMYQLKGGVLHYKRRIYIMNVPLKDSSCNSYTTTLQLTMQGMREPLGEQKIFFFWHED